MRPVRTIMAALALSAAAGCTSRDITAPQAPPAARLDEGIGGDTQGITDSGTGVNLPGDSTAVTPGEDRKGYIGSGG